MIVSYNVYDADTQEKLNMLPVPIDEDFTWDGRSSGTVYRVYTTNLDQAGNESEPSPVVEVTTDEFTPDAEMAPADKAVVDNIIGEAMAAGAGPGVVWYISGPKGTYIGATGSAGSRPITVDDHFRIGSATKPFVGMAVLRAVDQGLLSLEGTLDQFDTPQYKLSDIPNASKIKIRHLMMMRSGIFDEQKDVNMLIWLALFPRSEFDEQAHFKIIKSHDPMFEPGTDFHYTNGNYVLLGLVLQAVTGRNVRNIVIEDIFTPLGLTETSWPATSAMPAPYASGFGGGIIDDPTFIHPSYAYAAGCIVSTIGDLHKWCEACRDGLLLSPEAHDIWMNTFCPIGMQSQFGAPPQVGYGLAMYDYGQWKGHAGSWPGYECSPMWHPESGAIICIAENSQTVGTDGMVVSTFSRMFPQIAEHILPGSMAAPEYAACTIPADPRVFKEAPANLGYRGASSVIGGLSPVSGSFAAPVGADVFYSVSWDRTSTTPTVSYGGVPMNRLATAYHNNDPSFGGQALYRLAGAGTGTELPVVITASGGVRVSGSAVAFENVKSVGTASTNFGQGVSHQQSVSSAPNTITLQVFSAGARGAPMSALGAILGGRNRAQRVGVNPLLWVNTTIGNTVSALSAAANRWASIAVNLTIAVDVDAKPLPAQLKVTGGQPALVVDVANKVITPTKASLSISGGRPGGEALFPAGAALAVTGGTPTVEVKAAFEPFIEENVNRTNAPVPEGTTGAWVTLGGAGAGGGSGRRSNSGYRYGGGGGGGGAYVDRVFVPVELMGDTYTVTRGLGGNGGSKSYSGDGSSGSNGGDSSFISGDVSLIAGGGKAGARGTNSSGSGDGGSGGTASVSGVSASTYNGGNGGNGGSSPTNGQSRSNGAGAGGGGAGGMLSNDKTFNSASAGSSSGPAGNGGNGSRGGSGTGTDAGSGGDGYNKIEWSNLPNGGA
ncbi:minor tail protein [Mycobacterium phage Hannaconda]|nr:minor tail protein [Mycobacterium phage Hannaconda]